MATFRVTGYDDFSDEPELVSEYRNVAADQVGALVADMLTADDGSTGITHVRVTVEE